MLLLLALEVKVSDITCGRILYYRKQIPYSPYQTNKPHHFSLHHSSVPPPNAAMSKPTTPLTLLLLLTYSAALLRSQPIIPSRYDGFVYRKQAASTDTVLIEAFYDPVCPDSRDSWPPLKQAVDYYGPAVVSLIVHTFPLPYHDNAFVTSRALHIVNELNASSTYHLLNAFFKHQERFYNAQTSKMSREAILDQVIDFASTTLGNSMQSAIKSGFNDSTTGIKTRVSFKYGCSRGVYGTPFFFVNGFMIPFNDSQPIDYNGWRKIIDPLNTKQ
ncbi:hypothetical protein L1987_39702 [Smallanthus sonchifolius]|uniref:Uncharacterized protein n=1 Tax=Smallanthus sonchifolius TaxID=185202 RepID=A0ACB9HNW9_9ASTR|nr:hypothetical protein L1987_39702 [Smallanthus sonchifolius]